MIRELACLLVGGVVGFTVGHLSESNIIVLADAPHRDPDLWDERRYY